MVIVGVIEPRRSRRRNPRDVGERIRRRGVVMGRTNGGGTFIGVTDRSGVTIHGNRTRLVARSGQVSPAGCAGWIGPGGGEQCSVGSQSLEEKREAQSQYLSE